MGTKKTVGVEVVTEIITLVLVEVDADDGWHEHEAKELVGEFSDSDLEDAVLGASTPHDHVLVMAESRGWDRELVYVGEFTKENPGDDWEPVVEDV